MARKKKENTDPKDKPKNMTGFTILQIIAWLHESLEGCRAQLESEKSSSKLAHIQGKISGIKFLLKVIQEQFKAGNEFMDNKEVCQLANLTWPEILGAVKDMEEMSASEIWKSVETRINERIAGMKEFLLDNAENSRDLYVSQGRAEGMRLYNEVFENIKQVADDRRNNEPLFCDNPPPDEGGQPPEDPGTAIVPVNGGPPAIYDDEPDPEEISIFDDLDLPPEEMGGEEQPTGEDDDQVEWGDEDDEFGDETDEY
jgi:hypothetical protein